MVVLTSAPSSSCTVRMPWHDSSRWVAKECRSHCLCPAGKRLYRNGGECTINGYAATK